jgi:hypothetical protein
MVAKDCKSFAAGWVIRYISVRHLTDGGCRYYPLRGASYLHDWI